MIKKILMLLIPLVLVACTPIRPYAEGQREYVAGNYIKAAEIFAQHTAWNSEIKYEALYYEGMCWLNLKNYPRAKKMLTDVIEHSKNRQIQAQATVAKAEASMATADCATAVSLYKMLIIGFYDVYPPKDAYTKLKVAAIECGDEKVLAEFADRYDLFDETIPVKQSANALKRVRIDTQFASKSEALAVMKSLKESGVDSSLIRVRAPAADYYIVQVGAFTSAANATNRALQIKNLGWQVVIIEE